MRTLGIDYGDARVGIAVTDALGITAQGLETIHHNGNDKVILKRLDEIFAQYEVDTIVVGMPFNMDGTKTFRAEATEKFIHKLKCKYNKMKIETVDKTMLSKQIARRIGLTITDVINIIDIFEDFLEDHNINIHNGIGRHHT